MRMTGMVSFLDDLLKTKFRKNEINLLKNTIEDKTCGDLATAALINNSTNEEIEEAKVCKPNIKKTNVIVFSKIGEKLSCGDFATVAFINDTDKSSFVKFADETISDLLISSLVGDVTFDTYTEGQPNMDCSSIKNNSSKYYGGELKTAVLIT